MELLAQPAVVIGLLAAGGLAVVASGVCKKTKVQHSNKKKSVSSSNETAYSADELKKDTKKKSEKKSQKAADKKAVQDLIKEADSKPTPVPEPEETPVVIAPVEKKKETKKKVAAVPTPAPAPVEVDEKQAEIDRLKKLLEAVEQQNAAKTQKTTKKPVVDEVYNPAPLMTKEALEAQRLEEAHWSGRNSDGWTEVKKNEKRKEKVVVAAETPVEVVAPASVCYIEVPVAATKRGIVVGKQGETLKKLVELTNTKIDMPKQDSASNKIVIAGTPEDAKEAETAIKELISKGFCRLLDPTLTEGRITVEASKRTLVLGEKGIHIKKISEATKCKINFPERGSTSESVQLIGDAESVKSAKAAIKTLLTEGFSVLTHEGWIKISVPFPKKYRPSLIGLRGNLIKSIQTNTGCKIDIPDSEEDIVQIYGPATKVYSAAAQVNRVQEKLDTVVPDVYEEGFEEEPQAEEAW